jgi:Xaa-Pro aminopeptidase
MLAKETDKSRYEQEDNRGLSYRTIVAFGPNAAKLHYYPKPNASAEITKHNLILIDSGGQYLDGTTTNARTIHLGEPTQEQKKAYTNALLGLIRLSTLVFPHDINPSSLDSIIRGPVWTERQDYQHLTGSGIGSYLSVVECE